MPSSTQTNKRAISPWFIWALGAVFVLFQFLLQSSTSVMIPCLMKAFHIDATQVGVLSSSFFYTYLFLQVPAGMLVDRFGVRKTLAVGALLIAIACGVFASTHHLHIAEASRMLIGLASAPGVAATLYIAATRFPTEKFCFVAGLTEMLGMFGGAIGEIYLAQCVGAFGWRNTMLICVAFALILALLIWALMREAPRRYQHHHADDEPPFWSTLKCVLASKQIWLNGLFAGLSFALIAAFASLWCVPFLQAVYHISLTTAAFGSAMIFVGAALGSPAWGWLAGRDLSRRGLMSIGMGVCTALMLVMLYVPNISLWLTDILLLFIGLTASVYVIPFALVQEQTPMACKGSAMGFTNMLCIAIGAPLLQPLIGYFLQIRSSYHGSVTPAALAVNDYQQALIVLPIALVVGLVIVLFIRDPRRTNDERCC